MKLVEPKRYETRRLKNGVYVGCLFCPGGGGGGTAIYGPYRYVPL